ncbi:hypothetical protein CEXT_572031 [Caerostris extrusa]|uniref:Uncharacterized protein n=1 Tax=Caerostris extrusa TaxID=172846 RepID=A0AAV4TPP7_CAEEX|nr:hypothetical protein CEXT_572031 [Caerostris extrusa]
MSTTEGVVTSYFEGIAAMQAELSLDGGRWKNRLDAVPDAREGVALLHGVTWVKKRRTSTRTRSSTPSSPSAKDQDVVILELIEQIEARDPRVKLFIHYKHFLPENSSNSTSCGPFRFPRGLSSCSPRAFWRASGACLSSELPIESSQGQHEPHHHHQNGRPSQKDEDLPEEIQVYLQSTTYLTWGTSTSGTPYSTPFPDLSIFPNHLIQNKI